MAIRWVSLTTSLSVIAIASCAQGPGVTSDGQEPDVKRVSLDRTADYSGVAWLESEEIVLGFVQGLPPETGLWSITPAGGEPTPLRTESISCKDLFYLHPDVLPDGRLGFLASCNDFGGHDEIIAFDPDSQETDSLVSVSETLARFTWHPDFDRGFASDSEEVCSGIAALSREGAGLLPVTVGEGERRFRIDESFFATPTAGCRDLGLADWPTWSPDGGTVAFFASPQSVGVGGFAKVESPWNLYVMSPDHLQPEIALGGIRFPRDPRWSRDSQWLAFNGEVDGESGVWVFHPSSRELKRVSEESVNWLAWSPSGQQLAAIQTPVSDDLVPPSELLIFDIKELLR